MDPMAGSSYNRRKTTSWRIGSGLCKIEEGLFLGSVGEAHNKDELKSSNVTHILTVAEELSPVYPNEFVYKVIQVEDTEVTNLMLHFEECFNFINEARNLGGGVLVHCLMGISRSVTVVVAYLMKEYSFSLYNALDRVQRIRPEASPNLGFISQLRRFEKAIRASSSDNSSA